MKKLFFAAIGVVLSSLAFTGCAGGNNTRNTADESLQGADSINMVDSGATTQEDAATAEKASLDSNTQDTIDNSQKNVELSFSTFCEPFKNSEYSGVDSKTAKKIKQFRKDKAIQASLEKAGFTLEGKKTEKDVVDGETYYSTIYNYKKTDAEGTTTIKIDNFYRIYLTFPSANATNSFVNTFKSQGYRKDGNMYSIPANDQAYWTGIFMEVTGNKVILLNGLGE